jgi:hypothetical protein
VYVPCIFKNVYIFAVLQTCFLVLLMKIETHFTMNIALLGATVGFVK